MFPKNDLEFEIKTVTKVSEGGWFECDDGWSFGVKDDSPIKPKVGMEARFYGKGVGYTIRGLFLDGVEVYYKTIDEQRAEDEKRHEEYLAEKVRKLLEPINPEPQIEGFEWTDDMREISGFHAGYERACRKMVSQGCKWWSEHPEAKPDVKASPQIFGVATTDNNAAKKLEKAMMKGVEDCSGAMHHASLNHIYGWKRLGSWVAYQKKMRELKSEEMRSN